MARKPQIRYWQRKGGGYFTTRQGKQVELALGPDDFPDGPTYRRAMAAWLSLGEASAAPDQLLVRALFALYRSHLERNASNDFALRNFRAYTKSFEAMHGHLAASALLPKHVTSWLDSKATWNGTTRVTALSKLTLALNWGAKEGHLQANPLHGRLTLPEGKPRGAEAVMSDTLMDLLEANARTEGTRLFLRLLRLTGARPSEIANFAEKHVQFDRIVFPHSPPAGEWRHKTGRKTKRDRVIYLPEELVLPVHDRIRPRDKGPVMRSPRGKMFSPKNIWRVWNRVLARPAVVAHLEQHGIKRESVTPYSYRHTFISRWVASGRSIKVCADICGTSVAMIEKHYAHPDGDAIHDHYRQFLESM